MIRLKMIALVEAGFILAAASAPAAQPAAQPILAGRPSLTATGAGTNYLGAGTKAMAERLKQIAKKANPAHNPFLNRQRADLDRARLALSTDKDEQFQLTLDLSQELLNAGDNEAALV